MFRITEREMIMARCWMAAFRRRTPDSEDDRFTVKPHDGPAFSIDVILINHPQMTEIDGVLVENASIIVWFTREDLLDAGMTREIDNRDRIYLGDLAAEPMLQSYVPAQVRVPSNGMLCCGLILPKAGR